MSGSDAGGPECGRADDAAGIATRRADAVVVRGGGVDRVEGEPAMLEDAALDTAAIRRFGTVHLSELIAAADVVYEDGVDLPGLRPAFRGQGAARACEVSNARNWGEPTGKGPCGDYVPVIYAGGDTHVRGGAGQGLLIVDGDLRLSGNVWFRGVIIVTGVLRADGGRHRIEGGVVLLDGSRRRTSVLGDGSSIQYSECLVQRALSGTTRPNPVRNRSWVDVTASKLGRLPEQRTGGDEGA